MTGLLLALSLLFADAQAARVKDVASVMGFRENTLSGIGIVTGLNRTGDSVQSNATILSLINRLEGMGITLDEDDVRPRNVALVYVNATLAPSTHIGNKIDVSISSAGDARSLEGGILQFTPLMAADQQIYASAQGPLVVGGYSVEAEGNQVRKNYLNTARVPEGGTVQKENPNQISLYDKVQLEWILNKPDFTTASNMAEAINGIFEEEYAFAYDAGMVIIKVPEEHQPRVIDFISIIEAVEFETDTPALIAVNERNGIVVMGGNVTISQVAIAYGGLSIEIVREVSVDQPPALSGGQTVVYSNSKIEVTEEDGKLTMLDGATVGELVNALKKLGIKPRDLIEILSTMHRIGAIHAELVIL